MKLEEQEIKISQNWKRFHSDSLTQLFTVKNLSQP